MAIALRGAAVVPTGNPTTGWSVTIPSAVLAGDLLFLLVASRDSTGAGTLAVTDNDSGGNAWTKIGNSTDHKITLWYKRATSATASKSVTVANAVGSSAGVLKAFSGADGGATPYTDLVIETNASGDETHAGFTPTNADSMVCAGVVNYANDNAVTSLSFATLGGTTATEKTSTGGSDCGAIFGHALQTGGPSGTGDLTWAQTNGTTYSITWAIKPAASLVLAADHGSISHAGQAAGLSAQRVLTAATGAHALTGPAADVRAGHRLAAGHASVGLAGAAADFALGTGLAADPAAYALSGADAGLRAARRLDALGGAYALTGPAAGATAGRRVVAATGAYSETGIAAALAASRRLVCSMGGAGLGGSPAALRSDRRVIAEHGAYALTGPDASLVADRGAEGLVADPGSYSLSGPAATLTYVGGPPPVPGSPQNPHGARRRRGDCIIRVE